VTVRRRHTRRSNRSTPARPRPYGRSAALRGGAPWRLPRTPHGPRCPTPSVSPSRDAVVARSLCGELSLQLLFRSGVALVAESSRQARTQLRPDHAEDCGHRLCHLGVNLHAVPVRVRLAGHHVFPFWSDTMASRCAAWGFPNDKDAYERATRPLSQINEVSDPPEMRSHLFYGDDDACARCGKPLLCGGFPSLLWARLRVHRDGSAHALCILRSGAVKGPWCRPVGRAA
jgi:hypothetical protein